MEEILLLLENHKNGFGRMTTRKLTLKRSVRSKKMKDHHISDLMKNAEEVEKTLKTVDLPVSRVNYGSGLVSTRPLNLKTICSKILSRLDGHRNPIINN